MDIFRIFHLQCARRLPALPESHPCSRLHGHSFKVELTVSGCVAVAETQACAARAIAGQGHGNP
jgi:6-pyruvoyl-tetrahydropterin synthase